MFARLRAGLDIAALPRDLIAAFTVLFLAVPQGLAYATIAGLPPAVGLFAASIPAIIASVFRSSSHVVSGPTNALSLLVGAAVAGHAGASPVETALALSLMVGVMQATAGALRLGGVVDFISGAVVLGYITGAALLIAIGQLHNATGTHGPGGRIWTTIGGWVPKLGEASMMSVVTSLGTVAIVVGVRLLNRRTGRGIPSAIIAVVAAIAVNLSFGLEHRGLQVVSDIGAVPSGLPPWTVPQLGLIPTLIPVAIACAVLSLVESSSVARSIAGRTGQRLDLSREFFGQGLANIAAAFCGGYPVSGSLSRSALNERVGARTRFAGIASGALMLLVLLALGPVLDHTPIASLAGLMFVVFYDLVDVPKIRRVLRASWSDAAAFVVTSVGVWTLSLDLAIYLGIGVSLMLFLRSVRMLTVSDLVLERDRVFVEAALSDNLGDEHRIEGCARVRVVQLEGTLFFGAAGELRGVLERVAAPPSVEVLIVRLRRTQGLDATTGMVFVETAQRLAAQGRALLLAGVDPKTMRVLEGLGAPQSMGDERIFAVAGPRFASVEAAVNVGRRLCTGDCAGCPLSQLGEGGRAPPEPLREGARDGLAP